MQGRSAHLRPLLLATAIASTLVLAAPAFESTASAETLVLQGQNQTFILDTAKRQPFLDALETILQFQDPKTRRSMLDEMYRTLDGKMLGGTGTPDEAVALSEVALAGYGLTGDVHRRPPPFRSARIEHLPAVHWWRMFVPIDVADVRPDRSVGLAAVPAGRPRSPRPEARLQG
jgi:hypothetical protein